MFPYNSSCGAVPLVRTVLINHKRDYCKPLEEVGSDGGNDAKGRGNHSSSTGSSSTITTSDGFRVTISGGVTGGTSANVSGTSGSESGKLESQEKALINRQIKRQGMITATLASMAQAVFESLAALKQSQTGPYKPSAAYSVGVLPPT